MADFVVSDICLVSNCEHSCYFLVAVDWHGHRSSVA